MANIEDKIPTFSTWKMFNDTIVPALLNMESSETTLQKLSEIVKTREFSKIFVCNHDSTMSLEEHEDLSKNYKAFTMWLLGRFFYLLNCDHLSRMHDLIIDAQWLILREICRTQCNIYEELTTEYLSALQQLNRYHKNADSCVTKIDLFKPSVPLDLSKKLNLSPLSITISSSNGCRSMQLKTIKLINNITLENIKLGCLNNVTEECLNCLLYILAECDLELKCASLKVYVRLLQEEKVRPTIAKQVSNCAGLLDQLVFKIYSKEIDANKTDLESFENILLTIFCIKDLDKNFVKIANYIMSIEVSKKLRDVCARHLTKDQSGVLIKYVRMEDRLETFEKEIHIIEKQILFEIKTYISTNNLVSDISLYNSQISSTFIDLNKKFQLFSYPVCTESCDLQNALSSFIQVLECLCRIKIEVQNYLVLEKSIESLQIFFFKEMDILCLFCKILETHLNSNCTQKLATVDNMEIILKMLVMLPMMYSVTDVEFIFNCIAQPFLKVPELMHKILSGANKTFANATKAYSSYCSNLNLEKDVVLKWLNIFLRNISVGLIVVNNNFKVIEKMEALFCKIFKNSLDDMHFTSDNLPPILYYPTIFKNHELWVQDILNPLSEKINDYLLPLLIESISQIMCKSKSKFVEVVRWNIEDCCISVKLFCLTCTQALKSDGESISSILRAMKNVYEDSNPAIYCISDPLVESSFHQCVLIKKILSSYAHKNIETEKATIKALESFSHHKEFFHKEIIAQWMIYANNDNVTLRKLFARLVYFVLLNIEQLPASKMEKEEIWESILVEIRTFTQSALEDSKYLHQETLLQTIDSISSFNVEKVTLRVTQLVVFYMLIPTSQYSAIASNIFIQMAKQQNSSTSRIFSQYKKELCKNIADVCALNRSWMNYTLCTTLDKLSLVLGHFEPKIFIVLENKYLLPVFMSLLFKKPQVEPLIKEIATLSELTLSELLINKYGNIFLYLFLNESEEVFKKCTRYIEKTTGLTEITLLKRNFQAILNELLLNFDDKQERVLSAITILARDDLEDPNFNLQQIPSYLQPKFLGILAYFDAKLSDRFSQKNKILLSLSKLLTFMGPRYITPLRFKILATLTTSLNLTSETDPEINCDIWNSFIRSCEIEALGPQLATIFVSLLPLMQQLPHKINDIFKYLIIENEQIVKDYISDLFFIVEFDVNNEICLIVRKYLEGIQELPLKEQLSSFFKYLNHETVDIRVHGLKYVKQLLEKNRTALNQMILGYNGIDPTILELLDILMLICREKDDSLKLACGDCIGELGAIEPSHLPQKYMSETKSFVYFITEDAFIVNALNELTRALQSEKNTRSMDRFALAIQEILKVYGISPEPQSNKHKLWISFPEAQRELMLPLLSSRYTMVQTVESAATSPIYGTKLGNTFQNWINNWTTNLILCIDPDKRSLLQVCLPGLKQNHKTLMHFLPHILLHVLLESDHEVHEMVYNEIMVVISAVKKKRLKQDLPWDSKFSFGTPVPQTEEALEVQCIKIVFVLFDFLDQWIREWIWSWDENEARKDSNQHLILKEFLNRFCKLELARCNCHSGEYPRALIYLEEYIKEKPNDLINQFSFLAELYAQLDEPDGVAGVTALQTTEPSLEQRVLALEVAGKLADAAACYEQMRNPLKLCHLQGLLRCYLDLENVNTAWNFAEGVMQKQPDNKGILLEMQAESLWRLGQFNELEVLLKKPEVANNNTWNIQMGRSLIHLKNGKREAFKTTLDELKLAQVDSLGAASLKEGAYSHGYTYIAKLHAINELQHVEKTINELLIRPNDHNVSESLIKNLSSEWDLRLKVVQESVRIQEPILCLRRVAIEQAKISLETKVPRSFSLLNSLLGEMWLLSANIARDAGVHHQAYTYTLKAEEYAPPRLFLEKAKLQWLKEDHEQALATLRRGLEAILPDDVSNSSVLASRISFENRKLAAEARLLIASYNDSISNVDTETNIQHYKEAVEIFKEWEKSLVCLGQYYDRLFQTLQDHEKDTKGGDMQVHIINYFGKSLVYGSKFVYQSMPRMLSIWFDCGTRLLDVPPKDDRNNTLLKQTKIIDMYLDRLPAYIFFTAFSQLVSRICHPQKQVYLELKSIIIKLILKYPQQSLWMIMSVRKSSYSIRSKRCDEILNDSRLKTLSMIKLVSDFTKLAEKLIELCNKGLPDNVHTASVNNLVRTLPRLISREDFSKIMIPTQKFRKLILPNPDFQSSQHNAFPNHYVHIAGIEDEIIVLQSLQHPRKITFRGSDGNKYVQMLKPKDDLRKDFRLMEFNDIVNQMLSREAESRQRRLNIRLYSVVPLNEECGLIEWIPNLVGLRPILLALYKQLGMGMRGRELKQCCCNQRDPISKKREIFTKQLIPKHPPVLGEWFKKSFPDAQGWLTARTAYIRTTAVVSMVGYILGLGDRHGENILFDSTCGDTVHVDFNCLFNKGESFEWPERVPFRLTHNMVSAMGPLGVEGTFRKSCSCTLRVLRSHSTMLMSIVTPFVYDPLVSWPRNAAAAGSAQTSERTNEQAKEHIKNIDLRLQGIIKGKGRSFSIPLSVEGQTNILIQEAISIENLCQMYIGWGAYL